jgi:hypothetical protein
MESVTVETSPPEQYDVQGEPIVLSKSLLDLLFREDDARDLIALYIFYYYTAKWQRTNQIRATTPYVAKGIRMRVERVRKLKNTLRNLGLIEDIRAIDPITKQVTGYYVKVNFIWSRKTLENYEIPPYPDSQRVDEGVPNALSANKGNPLSANNPPLSQQKITPSLFDKFWKIYPRHSSKGSALTAWNKLCRKGDRPTWKEIKMAIIAQKKSEQWADKGFIPYASTWLNQSRWIDDPSEMTIRRGRDKGTGGKSIRDWYLRVQKPRPAYDKPGSIPKPGSAEWAIYCDLRMVPSPDKLVEKYRGWIEEQKWIEDISPSLFDPEGKVFQKFFNHYQKEVGVNFLTGRAM